MKASSARLTSTHGTPASKTSGGTTAARVGLLARTVLVALAGSMVLNGCLFVRETEHRIKLNNDGSGEAWVRLADIRSDGQSDSAVTADLEVMLVSSEGDVEKEFELRGRSLVSKKFVLQGDTLNAELHYTFRKLASVEGLLVTSTEMAIVVAQDREILKTNGTVIAWHQNSQKITWPRDTERLMYRVRERVVPPSVMLGPKYRQRTEH